jgi:hypothetical protein
VLVPDLPGVVVVPALGGPGTVGGVEVSFLSLSAWLVLAGLLGVAGTIGVRPR